MKCMYKSIISLFLCTQLYSETTSTIIIPYHVNSSNTSSPAADLAAKIQQAKNNLTQAQKKYALAQSLFQQSLNTIQKVKQKCNRYKKAYSIAEEKFKNLHLRPDKTTNLEAAYFTQYVSARNSYTWCETQTLAKAQITMQNLQKTQMQALNTLNQAEAALNKLTHQATITTKQNSIPNKPTLIVTPPIKQTYDPHQADAYLSHPANSVPGQFKLN